MKTDTKMAMATAPRRNSLHWNQGSATWGEIVGWMDTPGHQKEAGNYFLGTLRETTVVHKKGEAPCGPKLHRNNPAVVTRSAITLDADTPRHDLPDMVAVLLDCAAIVHTTFSSSPDDMRFRIIIPVDRPLLPDEYHTAVSALMDQLGPDQFDKGSVEPARYMFKPASQEPGWFQHWVIDGDPLAVDPLLADWDPDLSTLPAPKPHRNKRDPFELEGLVGAFNRAYEDWALLIAEYDLPYDSADDGRWSLHGTASVAGVGEVGPGLVYSHHITDPAYGQACSAFDLVRLHWFGHLDDAEALEKPVNRRPSHAAMMDLAAMDKRVQAERVGVDFDGDPDEVTGTFDDAAVWKLELKFENKTDTLLDTIRNWDIVTANDPAFTGLHFNEFTLSVETDTDLPWRTITEAGTLFDTADVADLALYLERTYGVQLTDRRINQLIITTAARKRVNPVRDYLDALVWDGKHRVETALPGVRPTAYTKMVARKCLVAAVARVYDPGVKWDHTLILYGVEGLGKTHWTERMARGYSASLGRIGDKDTLLTMQRNWIMISDEGYSLRKADADAQKEFLTKRVDVFRAPYDARPTAYPRHCVIWGSTNDEVFLRRQEGNRRFLIVRCEDKVDFQKLTDDYVDQVWAEAVHLYREGELLYLDDEQSITAAAEREGFIEEDALEGVIQEFLDTPVPSDWGSMSSEARIGWRQSWLDGLVDDGPARIETTCSAELYVEALGKRFGDHRRSELLDINTALKRVPGWVARPGRHRVRQYGPQQVFVRLNQDDIDEVI